jgi:hypothetical protein
MSYTFLLEQGEASSAECFSDIPACALSKSNRMRGKSYSPDSETESCHASQSGMTCEPSMGDRGGESPMSCAAASPAKTSVPPARGQESKANDLDCGPRWPGSLAKYDPDTRLWRTRQCSLLGGLDEFSETWPRWGTTRDGESFPLPTPSGLLELRASITSESGCLSLPSQRSSNPGSRPNGKGGKVLAEEVAILEGLRERGKPIRIGTPTSHKGGPAGKGCRERGGRNRDFQTDVKMLIARVPTQGNRHSPNLGTQVGGQLNPPWVEWLMGWPIGFTDLQPLAMAKFQQWLALHGRRS